MIDFPAVSLASVIVGDTMEVTASRSLKVNMGNYEATDIFAAVKATVRVDTDLRELGFQLTDVIDQIQFADINMAADHTNDTKSHVHKIRKLIEG